MISQFCNVADDNDLDSTKALSAFVQEIKRQKLEAAVDRAAGEPALRRLVELCETRDSGQLRHVAGLLAGLYNGYEYPYDLTSLRALDFNLQLDCLKVLRMDMNLEKEVHRYFVNGEKRFNAIFERFGISPVTAHCNGHQEQLLRSSTNE